MTFPEGLAFAALAIVIVMIAITVLALAVMPLKWLSSQTTDTKPAHPKETRLDDDEDRLVAALIASIDFKQQTAHEIRLKSIKEIKE